jgi:hypothetical protein
MTLPGHWRRCRLATFEMQLLISSSSNQTNLALKGMIGIEAMAVIANLTGHTADGANYTNIAHSYINQWQNLGIAHDATPPHTTLAYGQNNTHGENILLTFGFLRQ